MFVKRVEGPRSVRLPDGSIMTLADLPAINTQRWVVSRKLRVVRAVMYGLITRKEALERYMISEEEFQDWLQALSENGADALKATVRNHPYRESR